MNQSDKNHINPVKSEHLKNIFEKQISENNAYFSSLKSSGNNDEDPELDILMEYLDELAIGWTAYFAHPACTHKEEIDSCFNFECKNEVNINKLTISEDNICKPEYWNITNNSKHPLSVTSLSCNEEGWLDADEIRNVIETRSDSSERGKAFAGYLYTIRHHTHGPAPLENWDDPRILEPTIFFTTYGYGLCGHIAHAYSGLCRLLGLATRIINIKGHTFCEVRFDDKWHILDPNGETWYPSKEGDNPMSLSELLSQHESYWKSVYFRSLGRLKSHDDLFIKLQDENIHEEVYVSSGFTGEEYSNNQELKLAPGESAKFHFSRMAPWSTSRADRYWYPPFGIPENIRLLTTSWSCKPALTGQAKNCEIRHALQTGWQLQDVEIQLNFESLSIKADDISVTIQADDKKYGPFFPVSQDSDNLVYRLRRGVMRLGTGIHKTIEVIVKLPSVEDIKELRIIGQYQYSIHVFPGPIPGVNEVKMKCKSEQGSISANVEFAYSADKQLTNKNMENLSINYGSNDSLNFRWNNGKLSGLNSYMSHPVEPGNRLIKGPDQIFEFMITRSTLECDLVRPELHRYINMPEFNLYPEVTCLLEANRSYHWRVRSVDRYKRPLGKWCIGQSFITN